MVKRKAGNAAEAAGPPKKESPELAGSAEEEGGQVLEEAEAAEADDQVQGGATGEADEASKVAGKAKTGAGQATLAGLDEPTQLNILRWLDLRSLCRVERVSRSMRRLARDPSLYASVRRVSVYSWTLHTNRALLGSLVFSQKKRREEAIVPVSHNRLTTESMTDVLPAFLRHLLDRGARIASLEIIATKEHIEKEERLKRSRVNVVRRVLAERDVELESLAVGCFVIGSEKDRHCVDKLIQGHKDTLRTLVFGACTDFDVAACDDEPDPSILPATHPASLPNLRHLFLDFSCISYLEDWLDRFPPHLQLFSLSLSSVGYGEEQWTPLESGVKKLGLKRDSGTELQDQFEYEYSSEGLEEASVAAGPLHSVDFRRKGLQSVLLYGQCSEDEPRIGPVSDTSDEEDDSMDDDDEDQ